MQESSQPVIGVREGEVLFGKYRVDQLLGAGGMGAVVAAHHLQLDTKVAIKFLLPSTLSHEEAVARFLREARAAVLMSNEHVARIFDVGTLDSGSPYMVMEFLDGLDLGNILHEQGALPIQEAVDFVLQACEAVAEAHALGIVHRDLKPDNLFCIKRPDGRKMIKVLDFGISKVSGAAWQQAPDSSLTRAAALMGTPLYMSPEQLEAPETVDSRADIWALGIILYELLTAKMPFFGNTLPQVSVKIAVRAPPPLHEHRPDAPEGLANVIGRCLEKDREKRYANVAELAMELLPFGPKRGRVSLERIAEFAQVSRAVPLDIEPPISIEPTSQPLVSETMPPVEPKKKGRRGALTFAVSAVALLGLVMLAVFAFSPKKVARPEIQGTASKNAVMAAAPLANAALPSAASIVPSPEIAVATGDRPAPVVARPARPKT
ncbi:MAG TPA: serine/threonine-protein kinase, partial [Polyangiaceae bacterium]